MALLDDLTTGINDAQNFLNKLNPIPDPVGDFRSDGFLIPATYQADGTGLPHNKVPSTHSGQIKRNIVTWFIPEFGIVRMYVNPSSISYNHKKIIQKDRTKGGYTLQYWGEDLSTLNINGTTGSSGIEGINVLYEIYRAEQYAFDGLGLNIAANNAAQGLATDLVEGIGGQLDSLLGGSGGGTSLLGSVLGVDSPAAASMASKNMPSLAQLAFTVEMYYMGWVYRGFFESMTINERADSFLLDYSMVFTVTQRRGYRTNYFPWHRSAKDGPSNPATPYSFNGKIG
jgi:hypothetical protein